jgi:hypothetical protein
MKTNIPLKLDAALLREIPVLAAEEGTAISALLGRASAHSTVTAQPSGSLPPWPKP